MQRKRRDSLLLGASRQSSALLLLDIRGEKPDLRLETESTNNWI